MKQQDPIMEKLTLAYTGLMSAMEANSFVLNLKHKQLNTVLELHENEQYQAIISSYLSESWV